MHIDTTIAVSVTVKVNVTGEFDSPDDLITTAVLKAHDGVDAAINMHEGVVALTEGRESTALGIMVEGATALVNRDVVESWFNPDARAKVDARRTDT